MVGKKKTTETATGKKGSPPLPPNAPELLSLLEISNQLNVSVKTLRRAIASGELSFYRIGEKLIRISHEQVNAYLERHEVKSIDHSSFSSLFQ